MITGTAEQIAKAKDFLNSMSTEFMEETAILQLSAGVAVETVQSVLALYYEIGKTIQLLDFGGSRILVKGQKERIDNVRLVLRSFGLIEEKEGSERSFVKTLNVKELRPVEPGYALSEIREVVGKLYPTVTIELFELSEIYLLTGPAEEVEKAGNRISELASEAVVRVRNRVTLKAESLFDRNDWKTVQPDAIVSSIKISFPGLEVSYDPLEKSFVFYGYEEDLNSAQERIKEYLYTPSVFTNAQQPDHFDLDAKNVKVVDLTTEIAKSLKPEIRLFMPEASATETCTLAMKDLTWEKWVRIIERLYDYNVELVEGLAEPIYVVTPPTKEHETGLTKTRVLNISHGFEEVAALIASPMYGGEVYTDEINGTVLFMNISDRKMEQLKPMIGKIAQPKKMVEIKAYVIDSNYLDKLEKEMRLTLNASPTIILSNEGLSFKGNLLDLANTTKL
ncbi:MAG TPA: hypothetical protein PLF98_10685, partial [Thermotogota bacterium]|nr:hypothetical protein [Thermotogota bacterium]